MGSVRENIKNRRKEIGMTQSELAEAVGYYDKSTISKLERGHFEPTLDKLKEIASALGCTASDLWNWDELNYIANSDPDEDAELLSKFHKLTVSQQHSILTLIDSMLE